MTPAVQVDGVTKRFGALLANDSVSLSVAPGEIFAIVGENGAGKSTLMNVLYGLLRPDAGRILVEGREVYFQGPRDAIAAGIGMVHQHFRLVGPLTVAENVWLGAEPRRARFGYDAQEGERRLAALASEVGFAVDPEARIEDLPVGVQQRVEILKSLSRGARILILDEPTAVLTPQESDDLFAVLRRLAASGKTILFISHKLGEVMALSHRVAVMRAGKLVTIAETAKTSARELATAMVGRELAEGLGRAARDPGGPVLTLEGVSALSERGLPALRDVSLEVRAGEIVGIAGVEGNGQNELLEVIAGMRPAAEGRVEARGRVAHVPGDRLRHGAVPEMTVAENLVLGRQREPAFRGRLGLDPAKVRKYAAEALEAFDVRPRNPALRFGALSGGNQQKAVLARELGKSPALLLAAHPTRGVDIGAIEAIHRRLLAERDRGTAVLLVSADLSEVLALSDRIAVMYGGRIVHRTRASETSERALGPFMTGAAA